MARNPQKLYRFRLSGHSHRVELLLSIQGLHFERIEVDLRKGEHKLPGFLALNRHEQVPVLDDNGLVVADSRSILVHLASTYDPHHAWFLDDPHLVLVQPLPTTANLIGDEDLDRGNN